MSDEVEENEREISEAEAANDVNAIIGRMARMPNGAMHPDTIPREFPEDSTFSKAVVHWRRVQKEYQREQGTTGPESDLTQPEPDIELFHKLSLAILTHVQKQTAIKYAVQDAGFNIIRRGLQVDLKTDALRKYLEELEGIRLAGELASLFDLHEYRNEILLREIDRTFGTAVALESEKRKTESDEYQFRQDMLGLSIETARGIKELSSALKSKHNAPSSYGKDPVGRRTRNGKQSNTTSEAGG